MKLLNVSGFLGTGKTTFIVRMAKEAVKRNIKTAILVNEIGEIGVDDQFMRQMDLNVWEILGGCICCTLAGSLQTTLEKIAIEYAPGLVILEPSGAADSGVVDRVICASGNTVSIQIQKLTLVDPLRLKMMMTVLTPLITSQIQSATRVVINKMDTATSGEMDYARQTVEELNPEAQILSISARTGLDKSFVEELLS